MLLLKKIDWIIIIVSIFGICALFVFFYQPSQNVRLVIWADGTRTVRSLSDATFKITSKTGSVTVKVSDGKVRLIKSTCTDKWCIQMGPISRPGESMVCLPSKIMVTIEAEKPDAGGNQPDMITR